MFVFLLTDLFFYIIILTLLSYILYVRKTPDLLETWSYVFKNKTGALSVLVLSFFMIIALSDSIHFKNKVYDENNKKYTYTSEISSLLDIILLPIHENSEKSYSSPFSSKLYSKETVKIDKDIDKRVYPKLKYKGNHNLYSEKNIQNIFITIIISFVKTLFICFIMYLIISRKLLPIF